MLAPINQFQIKFGIKFQLIKVFMKIQFDTTLSLASHTHALIGEEKNPHDFIYRLTL